MHVTLVTGGARSGKSRFALDRAHATGGKVATFIATAVATDAEMDRRIARHRDERPSTWHTIEAPHGVADALLRAPASVVVIDCLTLLVSNAIVTNEAAGEAIAAAAADAEIDALIGAIGERDGDLIIVTNEVGWGVVPEHALARWFRDAAGRANQHMASVSDEVWLLVAGIPVRISP
jgi:adenosyl cobinamide kinase/adenosyl cobinamide phosphate guanylyltransferase